MRRPPLPAWALLLAAGLLPVAVVAGETPAAGPAPRPLADRTLRVDLYHTGDASAERFTLDRIVAEGIWSGDPAHTVPPYERGRYRASLVDPDSGKLLFRTGYDSLFGEYRSTDPAHHGVARTFHESVRIPQPTAPAELVIEVRRKDLGFREIFRTRIDPGDELIVREPAPPGVEVVASILGGDPHHCLDLAILGEGYTAGQRDLFRRDFEAAARTLLAQEPFASRRGSINLYAVLRPSAEAGCDEPQRGVWRRTSLGCRFFSFGSPRYLLTEDNRALRETARVVPYDLPVIMVNHSRYGGGGIYNLYCTFTAHNRWAGYLLVHELGHALAGLADEYYTSAVAYTDLYPKGVEPAEPNITALLDPRHLKWADLVSPGTPIPTPWNKEEFDRIDVAYQKRRQELNREIARAMRDGAPAERVSRLQAEAEELAVRHARKVQELLSRNRWAGTVGAFEGAGYAATGMYRPEVDCIMFSKGLKPYCAVCRRAIAETLSLYGAPAPGRPRGEKAGGN